MSVYSYWASELFFQTPSLSSTSNPNQLSAPNVPPQYLPTLSFCPHFAHHCHESGFHSLSHAWTAQQFLLYRNRVQHNDFIAPSSSSWLAPTTVHTKGQLSSQCLQRNELSDYSVRLNPIFYHKRKKKPGHDHWKMSFITPGTMTEIISNFWRYNVKK